MSFLSKFNPLSKEGVTLLVHLDVGEGSSRAALLKHGKGTNPPEMIYTVHPNEVVTKGARGKSMSVAMTSLSLVLEDVVSFISKSRSEGKHLSVEKIYVILGAPYYLSHTALIKYREKKGFIVTPQLVSNLLHGYRKSTDPEFESHEEVEIGESPVTISEHVVHIKVNGYNAENPYGKEAEAVDISVFKTEVASELISSVEKEVKKHWRLNPLFEPLSLSVYVAIRDRVHFDADFLFMVVGNEVTEVSLVRGFTLLETVSFPFGKHSLVRHLSRTLKMEEEVVISALELYGRGEVHAVEQGKIEEGLKGAVREWFPFFEKALVSLSDESTVPHSVYLVGDPHIQPAFRSFLEKDSFASQSLTSSSFAVREIDAELAKTLMHFGEGASCDAILCLEGLFALSTKVPLHEGDR